MAVALPVQNQNLWKIFAGQAAVLTQLETILKETLSNALKSVLLALKEVNDSGITVGKLFSRLLAKIEEIVDHFWRVAVDENVCGKGKTSEEVFRAILNRLVKYVRAPSKIKIPSVNNVR